MEGGGGGGQEEKKKGLTNAGRDGGVVGGGCDGWFLLCLASFPSHPVGAIWAPSFVPMEVSYLPAHPPRSIFPGQSLQPRFAPTASSYIVHSMSCFCSRVAFFRSLISASPNQLPTCPTTTMIDNQLEVPVEQAGRQGAKRQEASFLVRWRLRKCPPLVAPRILRSSSPFQGGSPLRPFLVVRSLQIHMVLFLAHGPTANDPSQGPTPADW